MLDGRNTEMNRPGNGENRIDPVDAGLSRIGDAGRDNENHGENHRPGGREREISTGRLRDDQHDRRRDKEHASIVAVVVRNIAMSRHAQRTAVFVALATAVSIIHSVSIRPLYNLQVLEKHSRLVVGDFGEAARRKREMVLLVVGTGDVHLARLEF